MVTYNFIEEYPDSLTDSDCKFIISWFDKNNKLHIKEKSRFGGKISTDIHMDIRNNDDVTNLILPALSECVTRYKQKYYLLDNLEKWSIYSAYNLQRYFPGEGYPLVHCEQGGISDYQYARMLVWTLYLNTVTDEGGTCYPYQNTIVPAKTGTIVLFPAAWTHMHKGVISKTQTKYIATGWFNYV
ncbi:2OG-Fe(II) oxygenase [Cyanophage S-RIM50]|uniref:Prolyl 4-hydroxylase alpha subunit Fe(2+) 2OG dioxygenase domain-containing protein n=1 Tax=Cyanophage S-RIM50 TaxID=687803 RepID=A0A127KLK2_9CAUD|nr:2OG-Fe(II) oxygenase [Cyanophage S-RIM50]AMO42964.1 hypothetical protein R290704_182 [Cyanophage S-RIM50]